MNPSPRPAPKASSATWAGLFLALFGLLIARWAVSLFYPEFSFIGMVWKEALYWTCLVALFLIIRRGEHLRVTSVNLGTAPIKSSLLWGIILAVLCGLVGGVVVGLTHFKGGAMGEALAKLPLWLVILVVLRAGVIEEFFYRGFAIERLQLLGLNRYWAGAIPLFIFGFAHATNGWGNVILALALGAVLTIVYLWRRDLVANFIGHFLIDFVLVVLPRFVSHH
ncbi:MAG: CPBP family intramembrane glutamic endopeptidase [Chthoniobacterales bacterium]